MSKPKIAGWGEGVQIILSTQYWKYSTHSMVPNMRKSPTKTMVSGGV